MNPGRFFIPSIGPNIRTIFRSSYLPTSGGFGLFGRITNSLKAFNWGGLLNGANKTLNVVNQTIPLVRQAGPMFNNMKSMLRIARAFGSETNNISNNNVKNNRIVSSQKNNPLVPSADNDSNFMQKKEAQISHSSSRQRPHFSQGSQQM